MLPLFFLGMSPGPFEANSLCIRLTRNLKSHRIFGQCKSLRINTCRLACKCGKYTTYREAKPFRINTYKNIEKGGCYG